MGIQKNNVNKFSFDAENEIKWGGTLNEFLWICAGVNRRLLRQCPTDYAKYAGTGGLILFTAIMAALSGGYALSFVFPETSILMPFTFGLIWGLMIFNLDRFMVNTMYSDGKHTISKTEFWGGLPRIVLAIFLGIVISTPLEIRIFQDKIKSQLIIDQGRVGDDVRKAHDLLYRQQKDITDQIAKRKNQLAELKAGKMDGISRRVAEKEKELHDAEIRLYNETNGTGVTRMRGYGPAAQQLQNQVDRLTRECNELRLQEKQINANNQSYIQQETVSVQNEIDEYKRKLKEVNDKIKEIEKEGLEGQKALTGFCAQIGALNEIASLDNLSLFLARLFITLLFVSIEVIPTLFKMMVASGPYDDLLMARMNKIRVYSMQVASEDNEWLAMEIQLAAEKNKEKLNQELMTNKAVLEKLAQAQSEVIEKAIEEWKKLELEKISNDPSDYMQTTIMKS